MCFTWKVNEAKLNEACEISLQRGVRIVTTKSTIFGALIVAACLTMAPSAPPTAKASDAGISPAPVQTVGYWRYRRPYYGYRTYRPYNYGYGYGGYGYRPYYRSYYRPYGYGYGYRGYYGPGFGVGVY